MEYQENGKKGFVNGEPEIGAQVGELPDEVTTVEEAGVTYYQFDTVFLRRSRMTAEGPSTRSWAAPADRMRRWRVENTLSREPRVSWSQVNSPSGC